MKLFTSDHFHRYRTLWIFILISSFSRAAPNTQRTGSIELPLPSRTVYQFPNGTWIENLSVRSNGQLLVTSFLSASVYLIDPKNTSDSTPSLIHNFTTPNITAISGITEAKKDHFYVAIGEASPDSFIVGSWSIWELDLACSQSLANVTVRQIGELPDAALPNGLTTLDESTILIADSVLGLVYKMDTTTGNSSVLAQLPEMASTEVGINGIKLRGDYLYWNNMGTGILYRAAMDQCSGTLSNNTRVEALANVTADDFVLDNKGDAWLAMNTGDALGYAKPQPPGSGYWPVQTVLGGPNQLLIAGATAAEFGRAGEEHTLYVTTCGGMSNPINGTYYEGGKVVAVKTNGWD